jgi:hypothetical protein
VRGELEHRTGPVGAGLGGDGEVAVDQHLQQPVGGGAGHAEPVSGLGHRQLAFQLEHGGDPEGVVDAADGVARADLHLARHPLSCWYSDVFNGDEFPL